MIKKVIGILLFCGVLFSLILNAYSENKKEKAKEALYKAQLDSVFIYVENVRYGIDKFRLYKKRNPKTTEELFAQVSRLSEFNNYLSSKQGGVDLSFFENNVFVVTFQDTNLADDYFCKQLTNAVEQLGTYDFKINLLTCGTKTTRLRASKYRI